MRLIDADKLKDEVVKWLATDDGIEQRDLVDIDDIATSVIQTIDEQPTAYDVDKVLTRISGLAECNDECAKYFYFGMGCGACKWGEALATVNRGGADDQEREASTHMR